jgi:twitching motility protein PilT
MELNALLGHAVRAGANDVHLELGGQPPVFRTDSELTLAADFGPIGGADLEDVLDQVTVAVPRHQQLFDESGHLDLASSEPGRPRFRVNGFRRRGPISFTFRVIANGIPSFDDLHRPPGVVSRTNRRTGSRLRPPRIRGSNRPPGATWVSAR